MTQYPGGVCVYLCKSLFSQEDPGTKKPNSKGGAPGMEGQSPPPLLPGGLGRARPPPRTSAATLTGTVETNFFGMVEPEGTEKLPPRGAAGGPQAGATADGLHERQSWSSIGTASW